MLWLKQNEQKKKLFVFFFFLSFTTLYYHKSDSVVVRVEATPVKQTDVLHHTSACKLYEEPKYALR